MGINIYTPALHRLWRSFVQMLGSYIAGCCGLYLTGTNIHTPSSTQICLVQTFITAMLMHCRVMWLEMTQRLLALSQL